MNYLVSGATGFIGRQLCRQLAASGGTVTGLSRSGGDVAGGAGSHAIDLTVADPAGDLLRGVDVFFHLAGIAHRKAGTAACEALNHRATVRLARLAADAGVRCFVYLSSVKAMGPPNTTGARTEQDRTLPTDAYGLSKWRGECGLLRETAGASMSVVIIRPALVYGANVKGNLRQMAGAVRWGLPRPPLGGSRSMVALDDLVDLLCIIARNPPPGTHTWIACGDRDYSTQAVYDCLREAFGMGRGTGWLPPWGWRIAAGFADLATGQSRGSTYTRLFGTEIYSNAAVRAGTTWRPRRRLEDVIVQVAGAGGARP